MQVQKEKPFNPIMQDTKKGALRYYTYGASFFNYGMLPQTWEDPAKKGFNGTAQLGGHGSPAPWGGLLQLPLSVRIGTVGDNDPLDVMDLSSRTCKVGEMRKVKILGDLELIDQGQPPLDAFAAAAAPLVRSRHGAVNR